MTDYLQPVGRVTRILSALACVVAMLISVTLEVILWAAMIRKGSLLHAGKPLWLAAAFIALLGFLATYCAWRILRQRHSDNHPTVLHAGFIQGFGIFFLLLGLFVFYLDGSVMTLVQTLGVALSMILVGWQLRNRQRAHRDPDQQEPR